MKFVGWDWASTIDDMTVLNEQGRWWSAGGCGIPSRPLLMTLTRLARHGQPAELPVIIERSTGCGGPAMAAGYPVVPVHPTAFHAARPCWGAAAPRDRSW